MKYGLSLVRRVMPELLANEIIAIQPMKTPSGTILHFKHDDNPVPEFNRISELEMV